jgi:hypothetical protein
MKRILAFLLGSALILGPAAAQVVTSVQQSQDPRGNYGFSANGQHLLGVGPTPLLTGCGSGTPSVNGTDVHGTITVGTSTTGCTLTFNQTWGAAPDCTVTWQSNMVTMTYAVIATALSLTQTSQSSNLVSYYCMGKS